MRLFHDFDEMQTYFIMSSKPPDRLTHIAAARKYFSLSGYIVDEMIATSIPSNGPIPAPNLPASSPGMITWVEIEHRAYLFGAIRTGGSDPFATAFLSELRSRPDIFVVITHSEDSEPAGKVQQFGGPDGESYFYRRLRRFEAPFGGPSQPPRGSGPWKMMQPGVDLLFGNGEPVSLYDDLPATLTQKGYVTLTNHPDLKTREGWLFTHKTFPVQYLIIMDATPNRDGHAMTSSSRLGSTTSTGFGNGMDS